jgi:cytochrome b involved in lipid metabolism
MYYYMHEVLKHNNIDSCWLISNNKIYDVTKFIDKHPGSKKAILSKCGTDVTKDYKFHSYKTRKEIWKLYHIGYLYINKKDICHIL